MSKQRTLTESLLWALVYIFISVICLLANCSVFAWIVFGCGVVWTAISAVLLWKELRNERGR